jgi:hypothetical protein
MRARIEIVTCFVTPRILKILKSENGELVTIRYTMIPINTIYIN